MFQPPTNGQKILVYGLDSTLLFTRKMVLSARGFDADTVSSFSMLRRFVEESRPGYDLVILCHTIPMDERFKIGALLENSRVGLYQLHKMETAPKFIDTTSEMLSGSVRRIQTMPLKGTLSNHSLSSLSWKIAAEGYAA